MKLPLLVVLSCLPCLAWAAPAAHAPGNHGGPDDPGRHEGLWHGRFVAEDECHFLAKRFQLTPGEIGDIRRILEEHSDKIRSIMDDMSLGDEQKQAQVEAIHQDMIKQIEAALTPDQVAELEAFHHQGPWRGPWQGASGPDNLLAQLTQKLQLTPTEQDQAKSILESFFTKRQAVMQDSTLSDDQKHAQVDSLRQDLFKQIEGILTPEQDAQFQQLVAHA